jgi:hypothetical protein
MQISGGPEFGLGVFRVNNDFAFYEGSDAYFLNENTKSLFFAPGLSFSMRYFPESITTPGFFFRDRAIFITNHKLTGTGTINGVSVPISETYSAAKDDFFISIMDFDFGPSFRFILAEKFQFLTDLGVNLTIMDSEDDDSGETLNYWGMGIFSAMVFQLNIGKTMYLEFGLNTIINIVSSQNGKYYDFNNKKRTYEDTGKFDLVSMAPYIHIGWKLDVKRIRSAVYGTQLTESAYVRTP